MRSACLSPTTFPALFLDSIEIFTQEINLTVFKQRRLGLLCMIVKLKPNNAKDLWTKKKEKLKNKKENKYSSWFIDLRITVVL